MTFINPLPPLWLNYFLLPLLGRWKQGASVYSVFSVTRDILHKKEIITLKLLSAKKAHINNGIYEFNEVRHFIFLNLSNNWRWCLFDIFCVLQWINEQHILNSMDINWDDTSHLSVRLIWPHYCYVHQQSLTQRSLPLKRNKVLILFSTLLYKCLE